MAIPEDLRLMFRAPEFWKRYFWDTSGPAVLFPGGGPIVLEFGRLGDYALELEILEGFREVTLSLMHPIRPEGQQLGWDDLDHGHPHVLRWEELDLVSRLIEKTDMDPDFGHPGLPLLLLCRFAPICLDDDAPAIFNKLSAAWRSIEVLPEKEFQRYLEFVDHRQDAFRWFEGPQGWVIDADPDHPRGEVAPASFRHDKNPEFPSRPLEDYMRKLRKLVGPSAYAPKDGNVPQLRPRYEIRVSVPEPDPRGNRGKRVAEALRTAMGDARLGHAALAGEDHAGAGRVSSAVDVEIRGDLVRAVEILQRTLRGLDDAHGITAELRFPTRKPLAW